MSQVYKIEKIETKMNFITLKVNDFYLHSKYNPQKEAEQFVEKNYSKNTLHILFGYGVGYIANEFMKCFGEADSLLIIDPLCKQIKDCITVDDNIDIVGDVNRLNLDKEINRKLKDHSTSANVICSPNYDKLFPDAYKLVLNITQEIIKINVVHQNTINFFAELWQENYIRNLLPIATDYSLAELEKKFDYPVVIASGGPSLTKQIPLLKKNRNKVLLIAAGSTINTLLHYDIIPDIIVSIDGAIENYQHFEDTVFEKSYFIYSVRNHYKIREQFKSKSFSFLPSFENDVCNHVEKITGKKIPMLLGGASVANFALNIALYISTGKIALIGQDLAYTNNQTHASYNKFLKEVDDNYLRENHTFYTEGYYGDEVLTDTPLLSMKKSFEQILEITSEGERLFNCTEGGVKIRGFKQVPFEQFCSTEVLQNDLIKLNHSSHEIKGDFEELKQKINEEINIYNKLIKLLEKATKILRENRNKTAFNNKVLKGLDKIDKELKIIFNTVSMNSIVDPITFDTLNYFLPKENENKIEEFERVMGQNKQLYNRLLNATKLSKQYTEDLLTEINKKMEVESIA